LTGARSGVNGTPTFYINGARHDGSYELEPLLRALKGAGASERASRAEHHQEVNDRQGAILGWRARRIGRRYLI